MNMKKWFNESQGLPCMWRSLSKSESSDREMGPSSSTEHTTGQSDNCVVPEQKTSRANIATITPMYSQLKETNMCTISKNEFVCSHIGATALASASQAEPNITQKYEHKESAKPTEQLCSVTGLEDVESTYHEITCGFDGHPAEQHVDHPIPISSQPHTAHSSCTSSDPTRPGHSRWCEPNVYGNRTCSDRPVYGATGLTPTPIHSSSEVQQNGAGHSNWGHRCSECRIKVQMEVEFVSGNQKQVAPVKKPQRTLSLPKKVRHKNKTTSKESGTKKKRSPWSLRLNCKMKANKSEPNPNSPATTSFNMGATCCGYPNYRYSDAEYKPVEGHSVQTEFTIHTPLVEVPQLGSEVVPVEAETVENNQQESLDESALSGLLNGQLDRTNQFVHSLGYNPAFDSDIRLLLERSLRLGFSGPRSLDIFPRTVHMQVDYIHHLVPDLLNITNCGFYWGKMDRYEAERLLDNKPEGTFLLRDSAQEDYLFSVSFRRYKRSLHARIEQFQHKFSFDSLDANVFSTRTVCGLIEYYKDPTCCKLFEPLLTNPMPRTFPFPLQHLCRATICSRISYDHIGKLELPRKMNEYLKEYHYKQRVGVRHWD